MMRQGWICSRCGNSNSPDITICSCSSTDFHFELTFEGYWQCAGCQQWVPNGQGHACGTGYGNISLGPPGGIH